MGSLLLDVAGGWSASKMRVAEFGIDIWDGRIGVNPRAPQLMQALLGSPFEGYDPKVLLMAIDGAEQQDTPTQGLGGAGVRCYPVRLPLSLLFDENDYPELKE